MAAGHYDLKIDANTDWSITLWALNEDKTPKNLTDYTANLQIRATHEAPVIKELTETAGITITGAEGKILIELTDVETMALEIINGVYDLLMTSPTPDYDQTRLIEGDVIVSPAVTR